MKLELKHIVGYLPYGLKVYTKYYDAIVEPTSISKYDYLLDEWHYSEEGGDFDMLSLNDNGDTKPILRPLTDLVKEIDGVVHAIELAKLNLKYKPLHSPFVDKDGEILFTCNLINKPFGKVVKVTNFDRWVLYLSISQPERLSMYLIEYLYENHFDIHNLIGQGLAIDINTL